MKKLILLAAGLSLGLSFMAAGSAVAASRCLRLGNIDNFHAFNDKTLIVTDDFHDKFKVSLMGTCPLLTFKQGLAIKSFGGTDLSCVSAGDSIITRNFGTGAQRCPIGRVEPYTMQMQKTDEAAEAAMKAAH